MVLLTWVVGSFCSSFAASEEAMQAGIAAAVKGEVKTTTPPEKSAHPLKSGDNIFMGDKIETGADGQLQILLLDETVFTLGPLSAITVDEFVYDPENAENKANMVKGLLRAVSSKVAQQKPKVEQGDDSPDTMKTDSEKSFPKTQEDALALAELIDAKDAVSIPTRDNSAEKHHN